MVAGSIYDYSGSYTGRNDVWAVRLDKDGMLHNQHFYEYFVYCHKERTSEEALDIQQTRDGGYVITGHVFYYEDVPGEPENSDVFILKINSWGVLKWLRNYDAGYDDQSHDIFETKDRGFIITGSTRLSQTKTDILVMKVDKKGRFKWAKTYGGNSGDYAHSIIQTKDGGYLVAGNTKSYGYGHTDVWLLKLGPDGKIKWQNAYGGTKSDYARWGYKIIRRGRIRRSYRQDQF